MYATKTITHFVDNKMIRDKLKKKPVQLALELTKANTILFINVP